MSLVLCPDCKKEVSSQAFNCPGCGRVINQIRNVKSRGLAFALAFFLGGIGLHKFYLGKIGWGVLYFCFSWTFIPMIVSFVEAIKYALMSTAEFNNKYGQA